MLNKELRFVKKGFAIEVDVHYKDYLVRANILKIGNKESNTYDVSLELRRTDMDNWMRLDHDIKHIVQSDNINMAVYDLIMDLFAEGYIKKNIERYEYEEKCFCRADELFNSERNGE